MAKHTFRIDGKDSLKKLIKLPTAYYRIENVGNGYIIHSHNGSVIVNDIYSVQLKKEGDKIAFYEGNSALKLQSGGDFTIEEEAIVGANKDHILTMLKSQSIGITLDQELGGYFGIGLFISRKDSLGELNCINFYNFYDKNDPVLQKIKEETGELYLTVEGNGTDCSRTAYISDENGNTLTGYSDYKYQYTPSIDELETIDSLVNAKTTQQKFALQKGEKLSDDIYEANIVLNGDNIAALPKIVYYICNDQLIIRDCVQEEEVIIPECFHFLKTAQLDKLTFCNILGNEFFEHKKYDPKYSNISDEYKFVDLNCAKKGYNLKELFSHWPLFLIKKDSVEHESPSCNSATVFELRNGEKFRKVAELPSKFSCFNDSDQLMCWDYRNGMRSCDPSEVNIEEAYSDFI